MHDWYHSSREEFFQEKYVYILTLDQNKINDDFEMLVVAIRVGNRALPVLWKVVKTKGEIGFDHQKPLLEEVKKILPAEYNYMLIADRFYGTGALVGLCQKLGCSYRIRLKFNLIFQHKGGKITTVDCVKLGLKSILNAKFNCHDVSTNIGIIHEDGHKKAWIIAIDTNQNDFTTLDYGLRWSIKLMFLDLKSHGFNIHMTQLKSEIVIEKLVLVLAITSFWAIFIDVDKICDDGINQSVILKKNFKKIFKVFLLVFHYWTQAIEIICIIFIKYSITKI